MGQLVEHRLQLVDEALGLELSSLDLAKLIFPLSGEGSALEQFVVDETDELTACVGGVDLILLDLDDVATLEEGLDDVRPSRRASDAVLLHRLSEFFVFD